MNQIPYILMDLGHAPPAIDYFHAPRIPRGDHLKLPPHALKKSLTFLLDAAFVARRRGVTLGGSRHCMFPNFQQYREIGLQPLASDPVQIGNRPPSKLTPRSLVSH